MIKKTFFILLAFSLLFSGTSSASSTIQGEVVVIDTTMGTFEVELFQKAAPIACANFLSYVNEEYYDGLIFHRIVPNFVVQGGGLEPGLIERPAKSSIVNEAKGGKPNRRGTLAMARTTGINSANSQFFINLRNNFSLDYQGDSPDKYGYTVFARVISGMDVVDKIASTPTTQAKGMGDVPVQDILILKARIK